MEDDFSPEPGQELLQQPQPSTMTIWGSEWPSLLPQDIHPVALRAMRRMASLHWRGPVGAHEAAAHLSLLLARLAGRFAQPESERAPAGLGQVKPVDDEMLSRLKSAEDFARNRMPHPVTVNDMAEFSGMSREYFSRCYTQYRGGKPSQFLTLLRLRQAQRLLESPHLGLQEIARTLGFASPSNFSHWFRRTTSQTPSRWRRGSE